MKIVCCFCKQQSINWFPLIAVIVVALVRWEASTRMLTHAQLAPWLRVETHLPSVGKLGCCVIRCFLEQMPKQCHFETFSNSSSTSQSQLKHPKIHQVSLPAIRETGVSVGSGTGQSPAESFAGCAQCFLPEMCEFPRISPAQLQELEVKKFLPRINLIHGQEADLV